MSERAEETAAPVEQRPPVSPDVESKETADEEEEKKRRKPASPLEMIFLEAEIIAQNLKESGTRR
ncbi:MAG: hypothetical protein H5T62_07110 [Anaerolineae bacterium]|nr:hypothetical protein [Anaerolineae bacterium]